MQSNAAAVRKASEKGERIARIELTVFSGRSCYGIGLSDPKVEIIFNKRRRWVGINSFKPLVEQLERVFGQRTNIPGLVHLGDRRKGGVTDRFDLAECIGKVNDATLKEKLAEAATAMFAGDNPGRKKVIYI